jgi:mRNA interferase YafQ
MRTPVYTNRFQKDLKLMVKRGCNPDHIKAVMRDLVEEKPLDRKYRDHSLVGNFRDRRECHIEPDWLLIYRIDKSRIIFERTGAHAELFK